MVGTLRDAELRFLDLQPVVKTEKFVNDDYTEAVVDDIGYFLGAPNCEELKKEMQNIFQKTIEEYEE